MGIKIKILKNYRNLKKGEEFYIEYNSVNFWVGKNGTGKTSLASLILTELKKINAKIVPSFLWKALSMEKDIVSIEGLDKISGVSFYSDKLRQAQYIDMDSLIGMGIGRIWASEGQNAQQNVVELVKYLNDENRLFILDETDGHLDFNSKIIFFNKLLKKIKGTVIVITHDSRFLKNEKVLDFNDRGFKTGEDYYKNAEREVLNPKKIDKNSTVE